jgi:N-sulfoglucosamine sulfohydrolase
VKNDAPGRRRFLVQAAAALGALALRAPAATASLATLPAAARSMNIIYIHCHDAGRYLSPYGHAVPTPALAEFARHALLARQAHCAAPTCSASRSALLTGQTPHQCGMNGLAHRGFALKDDTQHLAATLAAHGFETALAGIQHEWAFNGALPRYTTLLDHGFPYDREDPVSDLRIAKKAAAFLRERSDPRPFFLACGFYYPHRIHPKPDPRFDPAHISPPAGLPDTPKVRADLAGQLTACEWMDRAFAELWAAIRETGRDRDSLIFFTTDHGIPYPGAKCRLNDAGTGVALLLQTPGLARPGAATDALISQIDLYATACDYAGVPVPAWNQGRSLRPLLESPVELPGRDEVYSEVTFHSAYEPGRSVRTCRHRYVRNYLADGGPAPLANIDPSPTRTWMIGEKALPRVPVSEELYDLVADPGERDNLVSSPAHAATLADLRARLDLWMRETEDPLLGGPVPAPAGARIEPRA